MRDLCENNVTLGEVFNRRDDCARSVIRIRVGVESVVAHCDILGEPAMPCGKALEVASIAKVVRDAIIGKLPLGQPLHLDKDPLNTDDLRPVSRNCGAICNERRGYASKTGRKALPHTN